MRRYLVRLANSNKHTPADADRVAGFLRKILGSKESASHFRVSDKALEFNVFANGESEFDTKKELLKKSGYEILTTKLLDTPIARIDKEEALNEGLGLFNDQRFWESHEILEQVWREAKDAEHDAIQGLILTCAAFVHYQKGETEICLSVLRRAQAKLRPDVKIPLLDLDGLRSNVEEILETGQVRLFKLRRAGAHPFRKRTTSAATKIVSARPPARSTPGTE